MDTKDCTILKTLAEENNITYAARRLFMTQPALSERIKKLEKEFNCPIINRQARGVEFTYQGQRLVRYAEDLLNSYTSVRQELLAMGSEPRGTLNLGCSNVFAKYHIPHILSTFKEAILISISSCIRASAISCTTTFLKAAYMLLSSAVLTLGLSRKNTFGPNHSASLTKLLVP